MVKLRLAKQGRKKLPIYKLVAADQRAKRDGRFIESLGQYRPKNEPGKKIEFNEERVMHWLRVGAQPTDTVRSLLSAQGILLKFHLEKKKVEPARAEEIFNTWKAAKDSSVTNKLLNQKEAAKKKKADAEAAKAAAARAVVEAEQAAQAAAAAAAAPVEEAIVAEAPVAEAAPEAPAAE
ncbi:MAG TPA: 30S ribosomal protein S16 [Candidatus Kapabacteria bacterium]|nr:30S ribosomal protein S16 [Candidatus Kapabacteria bacterium]